MISFITFLKSLSFWRFIALFVVWAILISELLIITQSYLLFGEIRSDLVVVGLVTTTLAAFILVYLGAYVLELLRREEHTSRTMQSYLRSVLDNLPFQAWMKDAEGRFLAVNRPFAEACGRDEPAEVEGLTDLDVWSAELAEKQRADDHAVMQAGEQQVAEERVASEAGERWIETFRSPVVDARFHMVGTVGFLRDITDQRAAEQSQRRFRELLDLARDAIAVIDPASARYLDMNKSLCDFIGLPRAVMLTKSTFDFSTSIATLESWIETVEVLRREGHLTVEDHGHRADGSDYVVEVKAHYATDGGHEYIVAIFRDISSRKKAEQALQESRRQLESLAFFDPLTGLPNRRLLDDRLRCSMHAAQDRGTLLAVCYLDLDGFKPVNDRYGHEVGDRVLKAVAERLRRAIKADDSVARWGGDEFALLLTDLANMGECAAALRRLLKLLAQPHRLEGQVHEISASIGVTLFPLDSGDADTLLRHADYALYAAKERGRHRFELFDPGKGQEVVRHQRTLARVTHAIHEGELVLHYQPKVDMSEGRVYGAEALVRWQHPERGLLPPADFLPALEGQEQQVDLDWWVLGRALEQLVHWQRQELRLQVSVNVSAHLLQDARFIDKLKTRLAAHPELPRGGLQLEIIETKALEDIDAVSQVIKECAALDVSFAIDDFGTGYSSLIYVRRLPARVLKIDQSFVRDMLVDRGDLNIVNGVIGLAEAFEREVIAEGVESVEHGSKLLQLGCRHAQGYGIARPMPGEEVAQWIKAYRAPEQWRSAP